MSRDTLSRSETSRPALTDAMLYDYNHRVPIAELNQLGSINARFIKGYDDAGTFVPVSGTEFSVLIEGADYTALLALDVINGKVVDDNIIAQAKAMGELL